MKFLFFCCIAIALSSLNALPAQVIVIRHAEKDPITRGLSEQGEARAGALAYYLTESDYLLQFGTPDVIFASRSINRSDRFVPRTIETMMPLAQLLQMPIHSPYNGYQVNEMANLVLNNAKYNGANVLICWNHSSIHDLIVAFGYQVPFSCTAPNKTYPDCRFDLVFIMTFPAPPPPIPAPVPPFNPSLPFATVYFQQLMFGDISLQTTCVAPCTPMLPPPIYSCNDPTSCSLTPICMINCPPVGLGDEDPAP